MARAATACAGTVRAESGGEGMSVQPRHPIGSLVLFVLAASALSTAARAQQPDTTPSTSLLVTASHWGRWPALAGAGALVALAAVGNSHATDARNALEDFCAIDPGRCTLTEDQDGAGYEYVDPEAEALYQEYARLSRRAQGFLIGGQATLLVAGAMFLIDLMHQDGDLGNIPYTPFELYTTASQLGLAMRF